MWTLPLLTAFVQCLQLILFADAHIVVLLYADAHIVVLLYADAHICSASILFVCVISMM